MQRDDLSNEQKAELLFNKVKGLPCWLTDSVTLEEGCHLLEKTIHRSRVNSASHNA
jgi:hypothetical protein